MKLLKKMGAASLTLVMLLPLNSMATTEERISDVLNFDRAPFEDTVRIEDGHWVLANTMILSVFEQVHLGEVEISSSDLQDRLSQNGERLEIHSFKATTVGAPPEEDILLKLGRCSKMGAQLEEGLIGVVLLRHSDEEVVVLPPYAPLVLQLNDADERLCIQAEIEADRGDMYRQISLKINGTLLPAAS